MTTDELVAQVKELDRLYQAADTATRAFLANPNDWTNIAKQVAWEHYERAKAEADEQLTAWEREGGTTR